MTQEDRDLLLKDFSTRLPYGVICHAHEINIDGELIFVNKLYNIAALYCDNATGKFESCPINDIKPYLRPMSSMTEEEKKDILQSLNIHGDIDNEGNLLLGVECDIITLKVCKKYLGELNKRMFDVCHMIEKGLALEAPEGMY